MESKIKKIDINFEKSVLETYESTIGNNLKYRVLGLDEPYLKLP